MNSQKYVLIAQLGERMAVNHDVVGSNPIGDVRPLGLIKW